ncbi:glycosyl hydrolase family 28-related protein [Priestia megaterium]
MSDLISRAMANLNRSALGSLSTKTDWTDVRDFGAKGNGTGNDSAAIIAAIAMAQTLKRKLVVIPDGTYNIDTTIIVPRRIHLEMGKDTILRPTKDVNVIQLKPESQITGGVIDTRRFTGRTFADFTKACIYLDGSDVFSLYNELHQINGVMMLGEDHYYTDQQWTGYGIHMYSGKGSNGEAKFISFVNSSQLGIFNFERGIYLEVDETIQSNDEWAWITGCTFSQINMMNCTWSIYLQGAGGVPRDVGGNIFTNIQVQVEPSSERAIYCEGSYNRFEGLFWDLHKNPRPSIEFKEGAKFNKVVCAHGYESPKHFLDNGYMNQVASMTNHVPDVLTLAYPLSTPFKPNFLGNQDDYLVRGDLRGYKITQTTNHPIKNYMPLEELLTFETETGVVWDGTNATYENPIILEVDVSSDPINYCQFVGYVSAWKNFPRGCEIEVYDDTTAQWYWTHGVDNNSSYPFVVSAPWAGGDKVTKLRYKFWGTNLENKELQVSRLFAMSSKNEGKAWFPKSGGNIDGKVYTVGGLVLDKRTDDPSDAVEGQIWYRTDSLTSPVRVMTSDGIKAMKVEDIPNEYILINTAVKQGTTSTITENTNEHFLVTTSNNSDGLAIPLKAMKANKSYSFTADIEIINTVDDVISVRIYNKTKAEYVTTLINTTATKNTKQSLRKSFTLDSATFAETDVLELWIVQSWNNSTNDAMEFKVYKDSLAIY